MKYLTMAGVTLIISMSQIGAALAADGAALYTAKGCMACHGADGKTPIIPQYPKIASQNKEYVLQQLKDIKNGIRNNGQSAAMMATMTGVSDEEMDALADYISGL